MKDKFSAGALVLVLVISLLVTFLLGSLVLLSYYRQIQVLRTQIQIKQDANTRSGISLLLALQGDRSMGESSIDLFRTGQDTVYIKKLFWGLFDAVVSEARNGKYTSKREAILGIIPSEDQQLSFYLSDENRPLAITGKTSLKGLFFLPKTGIRPAAIEGFIYQGKNLVKGEIFQSENELPTPNQLFLDRVAQFTGKLNLGDLYTPWELLNVKKLHVPFSDAPKVFKAKDAIKINDLNLSGQIIIRSEESIKVSRHAKLDGIVLSAPVVHVENGFNGNLQVFATDSVIVGKNTQLSYPSVICLNGQGSKERIRLEEKSQVTGIIYMGGIGNGLLRELAIDRGATVTGLVYADGFVQHKGTVAGTLYCRRLIYRTRTTTHENLLVDATIDNSLRPAAFLSVPLFGTSQKWGVVKWLN